jgi:hypothetical protein
MQTKREVEALLTGRLLARGLGCMHGRLTFVHKSEHVQLTVNETVYRGCYITVHGDGTGSREFRAFGGIFDFDAIARTVVEVAEGRAKRRQGIPAHDVRAENRRLVDDLRTMMGGGDSHLTIEPSLATPGRVRVRLTEVELDPLSVLQLYAAVSRALAPAAERTARAA